MNGLTPSRQFFICIASLLLAQVASSLHGLNSDGHFQQEKAEKYMRRETESLEEKSSVEVGANGALKGGPPIVTGSAELQEKAVRSVAVSINATSVHNATSGNPVSTHWHLSASTIKNDDNMFTKTGSTSEYDAGAVTKLKNVMSLTVRAVQTDKNFRVGLTSNVADSADFVNGFYLGFHDKSNLHVPGWGTFKYLESDTFSLVIKGHNVTLHKNNVFEHTFNGTVEGPMYAALFMYDEGAKAQITELAISPDVGIDSAGDYGSQTVVLENQGPAGPPGVQGLEGPQGVVGRHGDPGLPATFEEMFEAAPAGPAGPPGVGGSAGEEGPPGASGPVGEMGPPGPAGSISAVHSLRWNHVLEGLDKGIKVAADMDHAETAKLNARMNEVNKHLQLVDKEVVAAEVQEKATEAKLFEEKVAAAAVLLAEEKAKADLNKLDASAEQLDAEGQKLKVEMVTKIEDAIK